MKIPLRVRERKYKIGRVEIWNWGIVGAWKNGTKVMNYESEEGWRSESVVISLFALLKWEDAKF